MGYFAPPKYFLVVIFEKNSSPGGKIYKRWSKIIENSIFLHILILLHTFTILDIHKVTFSIDHDGIFFKINDKKVRVTLYIISPESQIPKFLPAMTLNIGSIDMQITSHFEPFDHAT